MARPGRPPRRTAAKTGQAVVTITEPLAPYLIRTRPEPTLARGNPAVIDKPHLWRALRRPIPGPPPMAKSARCRSGCLDHSSFARTTAQPRDCNRWSSHATTIGTAPVSTCHGPDTTTDTAFYLVAPGQGAARPANDCLIGRSRPVTARPGRAAARRARKRRTWTSEWVYAAPRGLSRVC